MTEIESQILRLNDLEDIKGLVHRYAHCIWQEKPLEAADLFSDDGIIDFGPYGGRVSGREKLRSLLQEKVEEQWLQPFVHNHLIDLDGDKASGYVYIDLRSQTEGGCMIGSGYYEDDYVRIDGQWKFKCRAVHMEYLVPAGTSWSRATD
ncbi:MAG TPA: nuclear transport factor 2 family protein [Deltaproteobacteria bacterium]|nr:nuclear transport factor 2 family protein [Candidatus Binatota bacterium]HIL12528.1 nuclear transport factor 2 family protein [Deltaproteobacteria bacterium]